MEEQVYQQIFDVKKIHWWFIGRRKIIRQTLKENLLNKGLNALDIGSGTGLNSEVLKEFSVEVSGLDPSSEAIRLSLVRMPDLKVVQASFPDVELNSTYSLITMFDVLEHIKDDFRSLQKVEQLLEQGGFVIITVPAFPFLWSGHDKVLHHFRRYTKKSLAKVVNDSTGLTIVSMKYFNTLLFLPIAFFRFLRKLFNIFPDRADDFMVNKSLNKFLLHLFNFDAWLMRKLNLPFGVSIICVLKKKKL